MFTVTHIDQTPNCATPEALPIVDAAYQNKRGPAARRMREQLCTGCPAGPTCLTLGMTNGEHGVWGGINTHDRIKHGAPPPTYGTRTNPAA